MSKVYIVAIYSMTQDKLWVRTALADSKFEALVKVELELEHETIHKFLVNTSIEHNKTYGALQALYSDWDCTLNITVYEELVLL